MKEKVVMQYYYRKNECKADDSKSKDCICWNDEGHGPYNNEAHTDEHTFLEWRVKPKSNI